MTKPFRYGELHIIVNPYTGVEGVKLLSGHSPEEEAISIQLYARLFPLIKQFQRDVSSLLSQEEANGDDERWKI